MAQTIKCTECGAVMKTATPVPAGKRVKCPKCGKPFTVAAEEAPPQDENPFAVTGGAASTDKAPADGGEKKEPAKKGKGMLIGLIAGGVLLLCCCCPGGIGGGYWGWTLFSGPNLEGTYLNKDGPYQLSILKGDKAFIPLKDAAINMEDAISGNATYKVDSKTLEITLKDANKKIPWADAHNAKFTFELKDSTLTLTNTKDSKKTVFTKEKITK